MYITLVRSMLEYASVAWNSITSTDATKLEHIKQKLGFCLFLWSLPHVPHSYTSALENLSIQSSCKRLYHLDILFFFSSGVSWPSLLENVSHCVPPSNFRDFPLFGVCSPNKCCPSRCACTANVVDKDLDISAIGVIFLSHIHVLLRKSWQLIFGGQTRYIEGSSRYTYERA
jgi:hypothetical protein